MSFPVSALPITIPVVIQDTSINHDDFTSRWGNSGPAPHAGKLYCIQAGNNDGLLHVIRSSDGGNTWSFLGASGPVDQSAFGPWFFCRIPDGTGFWAIYGDTGGHLSIVSFDFVTETFGSSSVCPSNFDSRGVRIANSANGTLHLLGISQSFTTTIYCTFAGGVFSAIQNLTSGLPSGNLGDGVIAVDPADVVHVMTLERNTPTGSTPENIVHYTLSNTGILIASATVTTQPANSMAVLEYLGATATQVIAIWSGSPSGGSNVAIGAIVSAGTVPATGSFLTFSNYTSSSGGQSSGLCVYPNNSIMAFYSNDTQINAELFTAGVGGAAMLIYDRIANPPPAPITNIGFNVGLDANSDGTTTFIIFNQGTPAPSQFFSFGNPAPPVIPTPPPNPGGGGFPSGPGPAGFGPSGSGIPPSSGFGPVGFAPPGSPGSFPIGSPLSVTPFVSPFAPTAQYKAANVWDHCMTIKYCAWEQINWEQTACCVPPDYMTLGFSGDEQEEDILDSLAPYQIGAVGGKRFYKPSVIPCPTAVAGDVVALQFQIPVGYDGVITGFVMNYLGSGFFEGSGDLIFRVKLSRYFAKDFGNITTSLGTVQTPYPTQILATSLSTIRILVNAPNGSGSLLPGTPIVVQAHGWWYPCDESARFERIRRAA